LTEVGEPIDMNLREAYLFVLGLAASGRAK
jgi:hypothetical protein